MPTYTADPQQYNHDLWIGDTYEPVTVRLVDSTGTAYNLTGVTGACELRTEDGGQVLLSPTVSLVDAADGKFKWTSTATDTAALKPGFAVFGVKLTWGDGTKKTILFGRVSLRPKRVT